mmetsp:Transcript_33633/g.54487  ORF Transcript_33633/g.54487 Transcript_33633/m.54487 type:complete len:288 (+) Transcript_33633:3700-4563(+)
MRDISAAGEESGVPRGERGGATPWSGRRSTSKRLRRPRTRLMSMDGICSLHSLRIKERVESTTASSMESTCREVPGRRVSNTDSVQDRPNVFHGRHTGSRYTMPHRLTVAGEATAKSLTSNTICIVLGSLIRSPFARQRVLLSSSTVFMFSIHSASTGPSKITHFLSVDSSVTHCLTMLAMRPSVHSFDTRLNSPYSSPMVMALGFMECRCTTSWLGSVLPSFFSCVNASARVLSTVDLPVEVTPTSITPCRTIMVSYSWMHLVTIAGTTCSLDLVSWDSIAFCRLP